VNDNYAGAARFYDLFAGDDDLGFFLKAAEDSGGPCLEFGVGTGRVALEIAKRGFLVVGIDLSASMLAAAREKLARETEEVRDRLSLIRADMRFFDLKRKFGFIYSPGGGFQECLTEDDRKSCLERVRSHMAPRARLVFALWLPSLDRKYGIRRSEKPKVLPDGRRVMRSIVWHEAREGVFPIIDIFYQVYAGERLEEEHRVTSPVNILDPGQVVGMLEGSNFELLEVYGDFGMKRFEPGDEWMVIVARTRL